MRKLKYILLTLLIMSFTICLTACGTDQSLINEEYDMFDKVNTDAEYIDTTFNVATFNIKGGLSDEKFVRDAMNRIENIAFADIAGLQEVDNKSERTDRLDTVGILSESYNVSFAPSMIKGFGDTYGTATISKTAYDNAHTFKLPYPYKREKAEVEKRIATRVLTHINGVQIAFYNVHLSYEDVAMPDGTPLREAQIAFLTDLLESDPCPYKIMVGDFNITSFDELNPFAAVGYKMLNNPNNILNSYRGDDGFKPLDNIIYSQRLELVSGGMHDEDLSDHNMLTATFRTLNK